MKRLPMRKIREVLRLAAQGLSTREIALSVSAGRTTLRERLRRARAGGVSWPIPDDLSDDLILRTFYFRGLAEVHGIVRSPTGLMCIVNSAERV